jgi:trans-aconitate methyltransferase
LAANPRRYDIAYSIFGAVWFTKPDLLLPLIHQALIPGGVLAFSQLPANDNPPAPHQQIIQHHLPVARWEALLTDAGFGQVDCQLIPAPSENGTGTVLIRAIAMSS